MSTAAQVAELVQPFLERNPSCKLLGRMVVLTPVQHFARGIFIDRSSTKGEIVPSWFVWTLFQPPPGYLGGFGGRLPRAFGWADKPGIQQKLLDEMEIAHADVLLPADSLAALFDAATKADGFDALHIATRAVLLAGLGRLDEALSDLGQHLDFSQKLNQMLVEHWRKHYRIGSRPWQRQAAMQAREQERMAALRLLQSLIRANDRAAVAALLHQWEAGGVKQLKLGNFWTPTLFPIELGAGD